jgi:GNAT superfamily N-acetyltransferase
VRYEIRRAVPGDVPALPDVEQTAGTLFDAYLTEIGWTDDLVPHVISIEDFRKACDAGRLWVAAAAEGQVVGFALVLEIGGYAHLEELDVLPAHGRRGVGSALLDAVCAWAGRAGYPAVTLRTFRDIPWNAPFYRRRGFDVVDSLQLSDEHVEIETLERKRGLRPDFRVSMKYTTDR